MSTSAATTSSMRWRTVAARLSPAVGRTRLEWTTDIVFTLLSVLMWLQAASPAFHPQLDEGWRRWDLALGVVATAAIWWSRRYPVAVGIVMIVPGALSIAAGVGALVSVYRMGLLAPIGAAVVITLAHLVTALPYHAFAPLPGMGWIAWLVVITLLYSLSLCIGLLGRARRQYIVGLRESAARDRERFEQRLAEIRGDERQKIAREMHDVLAHRISLLSMHAGALEYRATSHVPPGPDELRESTGVIRRSAQAAVEDLRSLLGLLRSDDELGTGAPQPGLADLPHLVADAVTAGQRVDLVADGSAGLRESTERTAYRVVQEALTNARKHAPSALVVVRVERRGHLLTVAATNPVVPGLTRRDLPPSGVGLIGLEERVRIDGGRFSTTVEDGEFRLVAELPIGAA